MEILFELIGGILEICFDVTKDEEIPKKTRIITLTIISVLYLLFIGISIYSMCTISNEVFHFVMLGVVVMLIAAFIYLWCKVIASRKK